MKGGEGLHGAGEADGQRPNAVGATGVTGRRLLDAILAGERNGAVLAKLRDRRCGSSEAEIARAREGRYRAEHLMELKLCYAMWKEYQTVIAELGRAIAAHLK